MLLLAIDSATPIAGVALRQDGELLGAAVIESGQRHSARLLPLVDAVLLAAGRRVAELDAVAVSVGPGSFTGLRIGMAAAKGLCLALAIPLVGVSTLQMLAHNVSGSDALVAPVIYARKQEIYAGFFDCRGEIPRALGEERALPPAEWLDVAERLRREHGLAAIVTPGDGYESVWQAVRDRAEGAPLPFRPPAPELCRPRPEALAELAMRQARAGDFLDFRVARPVYLRLSEAEYQLGRGEV